jgi:uncharacterized membrane protein
VKRFQVLHSLRTSLWLVPVLCVLAGVGISLLTMALDDGDLVPQSLTGGPDAALMILGSVAASMVTLTGLVLTIVLVVVQLAMGQFSPRIVRAILRDRPSQLAIGVFVATFAHAMLAMRRVMSTEPGDPVPGLAIVVAFVLIVLSIVVLILYVHHIGQSLRVAALIESVGQETRELMDQLYEDHGTDPARRDPAVVVADRSGVLFRVDREALVALARDADGMLVMEPAIGSFVAAGAPVFTFVGDPSRLSHDAALRKVALGPERTMNQDMAYGFRMLVDIAERSLSDSYDDPTTAVAAIDRLHDLLRQLARRPFPDGRCRDDAGTVRLVVPTMGWDGYVALAFDEIRQVGKHSPQIPRRLRAALDDLMTVAPPDRREPLRRQLELLAEACEDLPVADADRRSAGVADAAGIGSGRDVLVAATDLPGPEARIPASRAG